MLRGIEPFPKAQPARGGIAGEEVVQQRGARSREAQNEQRAVDGRLVHRGNVGEGFFGEQPIGEQPQHGAVHDEHTAGIQPRLIAQRA